MNTELKLTTITCSILVILCCICNYIILIDPLIKLLQIIPYTLGLLLIIGNYYRYKI